MVVTTIALPRIVNNGLRGELCLRGAQPLSKIYPLSLHQSPREGDQGDRSPPPKQKEGLFNPS